MSSSADSPAVVVLTTLGADTDADALARALVEARLAACVNVMPVMSSIYRWKGRVEEDRERQLVIKTTPDRLAALESWLLAHHPYETPELLVLEAGGSDAYLRWVGESTDSRR
jgi:periplasmic divalent cation tolerance protein